MYFILNTYPTDRVHSPIMQTAWTRMRRRVTPGSKLFRTRNLHQLLMALKYLEICNRRHIFGRIEVKMSAILKVARHQIRRQFKQTTILATWSEAGAKMSIVIDNTGFHILISIIFRAGIDVHHFISILNWYNLRFRCSCVAVPVNCIFVVISPCFAIFMNVVHSLEPGETPSNSASHQAPNYVQRS